jgi:hypothetical protein
MPAMTTEPIRSVLSALRDEPGGVAGYLARWGATPEQVGRLRTVMLLPR